MPMDNVAEPINDDWDIALTKAFTALLGETPTGGDETDYAVYHAADYFDEFLFPATWVTPDSLTCPTPTKLPNSDGEYPFSPSAWRFDLSESMFFFDADLLAGEDPWSEQGHKGPRPFGDSLVAALRSASITGADDVLVRGADLGPLLERHALDLTAKKSKRLNGWVTVLLRVSTDGTLNDAMRNATFTHRGPRHLVPFHDEGYFDTAEERWEQALSTIPIPALRDHLRMLCLEDSDARSEGAHYCGIDYWPFNTGTLAAAGCSLVAGWEFGESQAGTAVIRVGGRQKEDH